MIREYFLHIFTSFRIFFFVKGCTEHANLIKTCILYTQCILVLEPLHNRTATGISATLVDLPTFPKLS